MNLQDRHNPRRERRLVQAASLGNERAVRVLGARLQCVTAMLAALNRRMGRPLDAHDVADLAQDVMLIVLQKLSRFSGRAPLEAWVYRICGMEIRNFVRRKRRQSRLALLADGEREAPEKADGLELRDELQQATRLLDPDDVRLVEMKHFEDLTFDEIALRLGVSASTLKTRYYRSMAQLQRVLMPREESA